VNNKSEGRGASQLRALLGGPACRQASGDDAGGLLEDGIGEEREDGGGERKGKNAGHGGLLGEGRVGAEERRGDRGDDEIADDQRRKPGHQETICAA
jgi:hypothetical protein